MAENSPIKINIPKTGMHLIHGSELSETQWSLLVNGDIQSISNTFAKVTNVQSNILCSRFKPGFKVINVQPVLSLNLTFFFLVNPTTGESEIGIIYNSQNKDVDDTITKCKDCNASQNESKPLEEQEQVETCTYITYVNANCLEFDINYPIHSWVKVDDCNVRLYFGAKNSPLRYIDYDDYQKETLQLCPKVESNELDCNKIKIFKDTCCPRISYIDITAGGQNTAGVYQFSVAYADVNSNALTDYFYTTNPIPLGDEPIVNPSNPNYPVAKSIKLQIDGINSDFDFFNLVVLKTINGVTTPYLVGTFQNIGDSFTYIYSGIDKNLIRDSSIDELMKRVAKYSNPLGVAESNGYLFFYGLEEPRQLNLQPVINKLRLSWQTVKLNEGAYKNPIISAKYQSFLRDEVYPFGIEFTRVDAPPTARFHIPAPDKDEVNLWIDGDVDELIDNDDVFTTSLCDDILRNQRWQVYNTATSSGTISASCLPPSGTITETVTLTDIQYCTGEQLLMTEDGSTFYYKPYPYPPSGYVYNFPDNLTQVILSTNPSTNPSGVVCDCSQYNDSYPPGAIVIPQTLDLDPNSPNSSINIITPAYTTTINLYVDPTDPTTFSESEIPTPQNYPDSPSPCINDTSPTGTGYIAFLEQKTNTSKASASVLYPSQNSQCSQYNPTFGSFVSYPPSGYSCTDNWYSFVCTSVDGVAGLIISTEFPLDTTHLDPTLGYDLIVYDAVGNIVGDLDTYPYYTIDATNGAYILLTGLSIGDTYYVKVTGCIEFSAPPNCKDLTFKLCLVTPEPLETKEINVPAVITITTTCEIIYTAEVENECEGVPYTKGNFAYWESEETYPCNEEVWAELAGKPIRHYKFPDCKISPHFTTTVLSTDTRTKFFAKDKIVPIGVTLDVEQVKTLLNEAVERGLITPEEKNSICGYRIVRGNRRGNESIIAKGILYDVRSYRDNVYKSGKDILFANYPYNDNRPDAFIIDGKLKRLPDLDKTYVHQFYDDGSNNRFVFHGANTSYNNPGLGNELKLELELQGASEGIFTQVKNHAKYQYVGTGMLQAAFGFSTVETYIEATAMVLQSNATPVGVLGSFVGLGFILAIVSANLGAPGLLLNHYYEWLDLLVKFAPFRNYAWYYTSVGNYSTHSDTTLLQGNIRRAINYSQYLKQGIYNVKSEEFKYSNFNNIKRESSVYINTLGNNFQPTSLEDKSRWFPGDDDVECDNLGYEYRDIASYYGSIKNNLYSQYGSINNIEYIDTGYNGVIDWNNEQDTSCDTIFGGDTFICRDWFRRQHSYFLDDAVGYNPNSDIVYSELGNVGSPRFFFNYPVGSDTGSGKTAIYGNVALRTNDKLDYNFACPDSSGKGLYQAGLTFGILGAVGAGIGAIISIPITYGVLAGSASSMTGGNTDVYLQGKMFLYSYGEPGFITESDYNLDLRHGEPGSKDKNFYPNVGDMVTWTQPTGDFNLINYDNTYFYNKDYSKQNKENFGYVLPVDFSQEKNDCKTQLPNRLIYSVQDRDNNDKFDGNLVFLANNYYDFSKSGGKLTLVFGTNSGKVVVLQEDQCSIFNSYISTPNNEISQATIGANQIFNPNIPSQYIKTDLGYAGSQTSAYTTTEFGAFWVDNKRGQIFNYSDNIQNIIPEENAWWFKENLPFKILKDFPEVNIDNPYKYFGMSIVYDQRFKKVIFTKKDYELLPEYKGRVAYINNDFILDENTIIYPTNSNYFKDVSITIGYSPLYKTFISFYTFLPNYYVAHNNYFASGINYSADPTEEGLWNHNLTNKSFTVFYGKKHPFIIEFNPKNQYNSNVLQSISYKTEYRRYVDNINFSIHNDKTFSNLLIYNQNQTSGTLNLIPQQANNQFQFLKYASGLQQNNSIDVLVKNVENYWRVNTFYDVAKNNGFPLTTYNNPMYTEINPNAISYHPSFYKNHLRNNTFNIRFSDTKTSNYQIVTELFLSQTLNSNI